jgi:enoyl-[acyl-carrier protein] reductase II
VLRTPFCDRFALEHPIVQGSFGPWSSAELSAAVSAAGGLGSIGTALRSARALRDDVARVRSLTSAPFAVNHTVRPFDEELFDVTLELTPPVVSLALGDPGDLVARAHEAGALFVQQVHSVPAAVRAAEAGADAIIAQGAEAGGFGGSVAALPLVPQVVDAVAPVPVLAAGGIADGRGLAAALVLGAQGVNVGTRFLAAAEAGIPAAWQERIASASSDDAVKVDFAPLVFPPANRPGAYDVRPRALTTPFVEAGNADPAAVERGAAQLATELVSAVRAGRAHELVPFTGQSAGLVRDVRPAAVIVRSMVEEAERAIAAAGRIPAR